MKKTLTTILLLFGVFQLFGQTGYKQNIADLISITFPQKPALNDTLGHTVFQYADSTVIYMALYRKIDPNDLLFKKDELPKFYDGMIEGIMGAAKGKLISKKSFEINGLKGVDIEFTSTDPDLPDLRFMRLLLINNTIITTHILTQSENKQAAEVAKSKFINSIAIIADKIYVSQGMDDPSAYMIGTWIGYLIGIGIVITIVAGIIFGIVFLIKRITRKKRASINEERPGY